MFRIINQKLGVYHENYQLRFGATGSEYSFDVNIFHRQVIHILPTRCSDSSEPYSTDGDSVSSGSSIASDEESAPRLDSGWHLRLLLSLEDQERTRTRLVVTGVLLGIIADIIDEIPGKVRYYPDA